jgi:hypothetical protein
MGYFYPSLIKDCVEVVKKCHPCQIFCGKMRAHPSPMFLVVVFGSFTTCHLNFGRGILYIIIAVDYFTKWVEAMLTFNNDGKIVSLFHF